MSERAPMTLAVAYPSSVPRALTGDVERQLGAALSRALPRPDRVSGVLEAVFAQIGGVATSRSLIERLPTGARAWLLTRAAVRFLPGVQWFQSTCDACEESYDLSLSLADVPRGEPSKAFPVIDIATSLGTKRFEVPNGRTELELSGTERMDGLRSLAALTGLSLSAEEDAAAFTEDDLAEIDAALDAATPDISESIVTSCPACAAQTATVIDPLEFAFPNAAALDRDTHLIASAYGWGERDIHALPSARRRRYAQMIAAEARGR
ncbi:hypothetical protein [uncultured Litoreibacter sp.]|uniref:hypothetical protein n=1 Tax=uncultured Litoreibacter sp. TaxID=1392394 RepID=UPI00262755DA|nr:hypothetical protein [uncultured Litoreibacter sp.]